MESRKGTKKRAKEIKIGPANMDNLDDSSGGEDDVEVYRVGSQHSARFHENEKYDIERTDSYVESHHSRGSVHNVFASPNQRQASDFSDHRDGL